jgi:2-polyprenyl-3-methyl-5-hydroxy-6-metoxy-1,4-benzoquinol methylase
MQKVGVDKVSYWGIGICHLCGETGTKFRDDEVGNWYECNGCKTYFQSEVESIFHFELTESRDKWNMRINDPERMSETQQILNILGNGESLIDVGCGTGWLTELIARYGKYKRIVGTDLPSRGVLVENPLIELLNIDFEVSGIPENLIGQFDHVINYDVIEHVKYPTKWFGLMRQLLKDGGKIYATYCQPRELQLKDIAEWRFSTTKGIEKITNGFSRVDISNCRVILEK